MFTVNYLQEDGTSYARSFDMQRDAVEDAMLKVVWNRDVVKANGETFTLASGCTMMELPSDVTDAEIKRAAFAAAGNPTRSIIEVLRDDGGTNVFNIDVIARF
jgi:phosphopantothenate synthetase